jgi:hypothetical protein
MAQRLEFHARKVYSLRPGRLARHTARRAASCGLLALPAGDGMAHGYWVRLSKADPEQPYQPETMPSDVSVRNQ